MRISDQEFNRYDKILYENLRKLNQLKNKLNFVKSQKDYNNLESEKEQLEKKIKQIEAIEVSRTIEQQNAVNEINTNRNEQKYKLLYNLLIKEISSIKDKNVEGLPSDKQSNMERLFDCLEIAYQKSKERIIMYSEGIVEDQNDILIQMKNTGMDLDEIKTFIKDMIVEYKIKIMNKITQQPDHEQVRSRRNPDRDNIYTSKQVFLYQDIKKALKEGKFVNASTKKLEEKDPLYQESQKIGIVNNHAFTILGAETHFINGQKRRYIRLRDPHAEGGVAYKISPTKNLIEAYKNEEYSNGIFLLDLEHFTKFFDNIYLN